MINSWNMFSAAMSASSPADQRGDTNSGDGPVGGGGVGETPAGSGSIGDRRPTNDEEFEQMIQDYALELGGTVRAVGDIRPGPDMPAAKATVYDGRWGGHVMSFSGWNIRGSFKVDFKDEADAITLRNWINKVRREGYAEPEGPNETGGAPLGPDADFVLNNVPVYLEENGDDLDVRFAFSEVGDRDDVTQTLSSLDDLDGIIKYSLDVSKQGIDADGILNPGDTEGNINFFAPQVYKGEQTNTREKILIAGKGKNGQLTLKTDSEEEAEELAGLLDELFEHFRPETPEFLV